MKAVLGRIVEEIRGIEVGEGVEGRVVGQKDGVGAGRVGGQAGVLEQATVEEGLKVMVVGTIPGAGAVVGAGAEPVVCKIRTEIIGEDGEGVAASKEHCVEPRRKVPDVDPSSVTLSRRLIIVSNSSAFSLTKLRNRSAERRRG